MHLWNRKISKKKEKEVSAAKIATSSTFYQFLVTNFFLNKKVILFTSTNAAPKSPAIAPIIKAASSAAISGCAVDYGIIPNFRIAELASVSG